MKMVTVKEMKRLEQMADASGHSFGEMMERAGSAVARIARERLDGTDKCILILVGPGNNGGDGLVAARYLHQAGLKVSCYLAQERSESDQNGSQVQGLGIPFFLAEEDADDRQLAELASSADMIIDALLGTGVSRPVTGNLGRILSSVGQIVADRRKTHQPPLLSLGAPSPVPARRSPLVVAVDVPSGVNCDTGAADPVTLYADVTITFAAVKRGQMAFPAASHLGELVVADIGIDKALSETLQVNVTTPQSVKALLPERPLNAHKGTFGKALIVAGSINYTGAPAMAAAAAGRIGAGLVTIAPPRPLWSALAPQATEATFLLLPHDMGILIPDAIKVLSPHIQAYQAMLLGPGLGREEKTVDFVQQLVGLSSASQPRRIGFHHAPAPESMDVPLPPLVIDADGLNALADVDEWWTRLPDNCVLTPHPGEMKRLVQGDADQEDRVALARDKAAQWRQIVVLKGAHTVVASTDGRTDVIPFANPGLATAGSGDVLAGAIVGLLAQGMSPFDAARCGAYLHGLAGTLALQRFGVSVAGGAGLLASDLIPFLPQAMERTKQS